MSDSYQQVQHNPRELFPGLKPDRGKRQKLQRLLNRALSFAFTKHTNAGLPSVHPEIVLCRRIHSGLLRAAEANKELRRVGMDGLVRRRGGRR